MCTHKSFLAALGAATLVVLIAASAHAWGSPGTNYLTFSRAVALPGVTLAPGTYIFRLPSETDRNIVQVLTRDTSKPIYMGMTRPVERPRGDMKRMVTLGETSAAQAPPIAAWFPIGERDGHEFIYNR
jgi:inosine-uridine nucleoside N-ribohydrolase